MRHLISTILLLFISCLVSLSQSITTAEYFFDTDPGIGNGMPLTVISDDEWEFSIPITGLDSGFHKLSIRIEQGDTAWSLTETRMFYIKSASEPEEHPQLVNGEYFFDTDPGVGNGTAFTFTADDSIEITEIVETAGLASGFHRLSYRIINENGEWSHSESRVIYIHEETENEPFVIAGGEYFFDTDPGIGNGTPFSLEQADTINFEQLIDVSGLTEGFHKLSVRVFNENRTSGFSESRLFYIKPASPATETPNLVAMEYCIDDTLGNGNEIPVSVMEADTIDVMLNIPMTGINAGKHAIAFRVKNAEGTWSNSATDTFQIESDEPSELALHTTVSTTSNSIALEIFGTGGTPSYQYKAILCDAQGANCQETPWQQSNTIVFDGLQDSTTYTVETQIQDANQNTASENVGSVTTYETCIFGITATTLDLPYTSGSDNSISILTNSDWYIDYIMDGWISIDPLNGTGSSTINITYSANNTGNARSETIFIGGTCSDGEIPVTINQAADEVTVPADEQVSSTILTNGTTDCFNATNTITIAGDGTSVVVESGASADFIAGQSIRFMPGFYAQEGSYVHGHITTTGTYCVETAPAIVAAETANEKEAVIVDAELTEHAEPEMVVYPNPNNGEFTVEFRNFEAEIQVMLFNSIGQMVYNEQTTDKQIRMRVPNLKSGMYFIKAVNKNKQFNQKIVVQ